MTKKGNMSDSDAVCQIMPTRPDKANSCFEDAETVLRSVRDGIPLKRKKLCGHTTF
jgi:hypothetical protein